eukprot:3588847-Lingulodinium_polyedra.AAC.1
MARAARAKPNTAAGWTRTPRPPRPRARPTTDNVRPRRGAGQNTLARRAFCPRQFAQLRL